RFSRFSRFSRRPSRVPGYSSTPARCALSRACYDHDMVAGSWRRGALATLAMTLLMVRPAAAEPSASKVGSHQVSAKLGGDTPPSLRTAEPSQVAAEPNTGAVPSGAHLVEPVLPPLKLTPPP